MATTDAISAVPDTATRVTERDIPCTLGGAFREFFRHASPCILLALLALSLGARIATGAWSSADAVPVVVLLAVWPLQEWLIHVLILHFRPRRILGIEVDFRVPRKHRQHHRNPGDLDNLFIPVHSFLYTIPLAGWLWYVLTPTPALALTGLCAYFALALHYEWVHFLVHTRYVPRSRIYSRLWRNHRLHHFKNEHYWFGVTMLRADALLRTAPHHTEVATSETCRSLLADPEGLSEQRTAA